MFYYKTIVRNILIFNLFQLYTFAINQHDYLDSELFRSGNFEGININDPPWISESGTCETLVTRKCTSLGQNVLSSTAPELLLSPIARRKSPIDTPLKVSWTAVKCDTIDENNPIIGTGTGNQYDPTKYNQRISRNHRDGYKRIFENYICLEEPIINPLHRIYKFDNHQNHQKPLIDDQGNMIVMEENIGEIYNRDNTHSRQFTQQKHRQQYVQAEQQQQIEDEIWKKQRKETMCHTTNRSPIICLQTIPEIPANPDGASYGGRPEIDEISKHSSVLSNKLSSRKRGSHCTCYHRQDTMGLSKDSYSQQNRPTISHNFPLDHEYPSTSNIYSGSAEDYFQKSE